MIELLSSHKKNYIKELIRNESANMVCNKKTNTDNVNFSIV